MKTLVVGLMLLSMAGVASAALIWSEDFAYADGELVTVSGGNWARLSGTGDDMLVSGGSLAVSGSLTDDNERALDQGYSAGSLYYAFTVNFSAIPTAGGAYFAAFNNGSSYRDRMYANTGSGSNFRLGIGNGSTVGATWASDLTLGTSYRVVVRSDLDTDTSYLWVDPVNELSTSINNSTASTVNPDAFTFRQAAGEGTMTIDALRVGSTFEDVIPEPGTMALVLVGLGGLKAFARRRKAA